MKSSLKKLLVVVLLFSLAVLGSLCFALSRKQNGANPFPMWLKIPDGEQLECPEYAQLRYTGCSFDSSSEEEEQAVLQIECTSTKPIVCWSGSFFILYQNKEDSAWHIVFATSYAVKAAGTLDPPGTKTLECVVPRKLFSHAGAYKIGFPERGACDLPREALWEGTDKKCGSSDGFSTESGFPMYQDSKLAGPPEAQPGTELAAVELIEGAESDTLKLTVTAQESTAVDDGFYQVLFCPPKDEKLYQVYCPAETFFHDFSVQTNNSELAPGLNTLEYPVPKGLFQQKGEYYLVCTLGGFRLFGN